MLKSQNGGVLKEGTEDLMQKKTWDTNVITPGTPFMNTLAICLRYWCAHKVNTDPAWEKVPMIIFTSDILLLIPIGQNHTFRCERARGR